LKTQDLKEADKLVWLYTEKLGKISAVARGAKRSKSKFLASTLPFCFGEYIVYKGRSLYNISEGAIINSFQELMGDLDHLTYASYLCELIDIAVQEEESNRELFKTFVSCFYLMSKKVVDLEVMARAFEVKLLEATGYGLNLEYCCQCKSKINTSNYISFQYGGGVCNQCEKVNGMYVSYATYNILKFLSKLSIDKVYRVSMKTEEKDELYRVLSIIIAQNYTRKPKSLEIYAFLKKE